MIDITEYKDYGIFLFEEIDGDRICIIAFDWDRNGMAYSKPIYVNNAVEKQQDKSVDYRWHLNQIVTSEKDMLYFYENNYKITKLTPGNIKAKMFTALL